MALEKIVINVSGQADLDSTIKKLVELGVVDEKNAKQFTQNSKETQKNLDQTKSSYSGLKDAANNYVQALPGAQHVQQIANLTKGINASTVATGGMSKAMQFLKIAIASTGIGLLVVALGSLYAYFKRSEEGSDKLAKVMAILGVAVDEIVKGLVKLAEIIIDVITPAFTLWFTGLTKIYDFITNALFKAIETLGKTMSALGFEDAGKAVAGFNDKLKQGKKDLEEYAKGIIKAGSAIADLEDSLEDLTLDIKRQNDILTTTIEKQLKALRNRTNTYKESLSIIDEIAKAEKQRFSNSTLLINKEMELQRQKFLAETNGVKGNAKIFDDYIKGVINTEELKTKANGLATQDTINNINEILAKQEEANRQSLVLEERLQNFRDAALEKEKARIEKEKELRKQLLDSQLQDLNNLKKLELDTSNKRIQLKKIETKEISKTLDEALERDYKKAQADVDRRKHLQQAYTDFAINTINQVASAKVEADRIKTDNEINRLQKETDEQSKALDKQVEKGIISAEQAARAKEELEKRQRQKEKELKQKQAKEEKNFALFQIAINTASAIIKQLAATPLPAGAPLVALIAASGAVQAAIVASRPEPQFKEGGYTGDGNPNDRAGIVHKSEFVMPADKTSKYRKELEAMYSGNYREPIRLERSLSDIRHDNMADNIYNSMMHNGMDDSRIVNAISRNNKIKMGNTDELAGKIASKISDRLSEGRLYA